MTKGVAAGACIAKLQTLINLESFRKINRRLAGILHGIERFSRLQASVRQSKFDLICVTVRTNYVSRLCYVHPESIEHSSHTHDGCSTSNAAIMPVPTPSASSLLMHALYLQKSLAITDGPLDALTFTHFHTSSHTSSPTIILTASPSDTSQVTPLHSQTFPTFKLSFEPKRFLPFLPKIALCPSSCELIL